MYNIYKVYANEYEDIKGFNVIANSFSEVEHLMKETHPYCTIKNITLCADKEVESDKVILLK